MPEIHAHKVLNILREQPMTEHELVLAVTDMFGEHVSFRTCKQADFTLSELMAFLVEREKIIEMDGKWSVNVERVCNH